MRLRGPEDEAHARAEGAGSPAVVLLGPLVVASQAGARLPAELRAAHRVVRLPDAPVALEADAIVLREPGPAAFVGWFRANPTRPVLALEGRTFSMVALRGFTWAVGASATGRHFLEGAVALARGLSGGVDLADPPIQPLTPRERRALTDAVRLGSSAGAGGWNEAELTRTLESACRKMCVLDPLGALLVDAAQELIDRPTAGG